MRSPFESKAESCAGARRLSLASRSGGAEGAEPFEREAIAEIVQHRALELLGQRNPRVAHREPRPFGDLPGKLPCPWQQLFARHDLANHAEGFRRGARRASARSAENSGRD